MELVFEFCSSIIEDLIDCDVVYALRNLVLKLLWLLFWDTLLFCIVRMYKHFETSFLHLVILPTGYILIKIVMAKPNCNHMHALQLSSNFSGELPLTTQIWVMVLNQQLFSGIAFTHNVLCISPSSPK